MNYRNFFAVLLPTFLSAAACAQDTAFTYQGRLTDGAAAANGLYDFTFQLFDAPAGGTSQGAAITTNGVTLVNGLFTVAMDFGAAPFNTGGPRWLEIGVRTNGGNVFATISPRAPLSPAPYAITASNLSGVVSSRGLSGAYTNALTLNNPANSFTGNGAGLTNLNGANIAAGTISDSRLATISTSGKVANSALNSSVTLLGQTIEGSEITDGTIANADISPTAAIADTKLATIATAGKVSDSALSANVALLNSAQTFSADKLFSSGVQIQADSGVATAPGLTFNGDPDTGIFRPGANTIAIATAGAEQMRINAAGNVGIGTASPSRELEVQNSGDVEIGLRSADTGGRLWTLQSSGINGGSDDGSFQIIDRTANGSRFLIRTNGDVGVGTTSPVARLHVAGGTDASLTGGGYIVAGNLNGFSLAIDDNEIMARNNGAVSTLFLNQNYPPGQTCLGTPGIVVGGNLVPKVDADQDVGDCNRAWLDIFSHNFDNVSDGRLKDHIEPIQYGLGTVLSLRPVSYQWKVKSDGRINLGLIAQEVEPLVPEAVSAGGGPESRLSLRYNYFIPILIKAVQEQQTIIDDQRAQNAELKARLERLEKVVNSALRQ